LDFREAGAPMYRTYFSISHRGRDSLDVFDVELRLHARHGTVASDCVVDGHLEKERAISILPSYILEMSIPIVLGSVPNVTNRRAK